MRKIVIIGSPGSGKTTLAQRLAESLGLPWLELDSLFHPPVEARDWSTFSQALRSFLQRHEGWVVDGNHPAARKLVIPQADLVVWLDIPLTVRAVSLAKRTLTRLRRGDPLLRGNPKRKADLFSLDPRRWPAVRAVLRQRRDRETFQRVLAPGPARKRRKQGAPSAKPPQPPTPGSARASTAKPARPGRDGRRKAQARVVRLESRSQVEGWIRGLAATT